MFEENVFLIGFMGTGKTTVAMELGRQCAIEVIEMDKLIVSKEGKSIPDIFATHGEEYFRNLETIFLKELKTKTNSVVSCGGGAVLRLGNVVLMKEMGIVVLLTAEPEEILRRLKDDEERPILRGRKNVAAITELLEERRSAYEAAADIVISTDGKEIMEICQELMDKLKRRKERE